MSKIALTVAFEKLRKMCQTAAIPPAEVPRERAWNTELNRSGHLLMIHLVTLSIARTLYCSVARRPVIKESDKNEEGKCRLISVAE